MLIDFITGLEIKERYLNDQLKKLLKEHKAIINKPVEDVWYPSSLPSINSLLGGKGLRGGRLHQIIGNESSGKTTVSLDFLVQEQKRGNIVAYIDFERTFDPLYAKTLGLDISEERFIRVTADDAETGLHLSEELVKSGITAFIIDSIPAALPSSEKEKDLTESAKMAVSAGYITRWCKRIIPLLDNYNALGIVINQNRANFSQMSPKETKPFGAKQLQYSVSSTIELRVLKREEDQKHIQATVEKTKQGSTERAKCEFVIEYGVGVDVARDVLMLALEKEIIKKSGAWFMFREIKAQGMDQAKQMFPIEEIKGML
jgi:recombination protein RecA